jgi:phosphate uptake regulator
MKNTFREEFETVQARALSVACSAEEMLRNSIHAMRTRDEPLADRVRSGEEVLLLEMERINDEIFIFIAMNQPLEADIAKIAGMITLMASMEQVTRNASEIALIAKGYPYTLVNDRIFEICSITNMADKTLSMVHDTLAAFGSSSPDLLSRHAERNEEIRTMAINAMRTGLEKITDDPRDIGAMEQVLMVIRALEATSMNLFIAAERITESAGRVSRTPVECE